MKYKLFFLKLKIRNRLNDFNLNKKIKKDLYDLTISEYNLAINEEKSDVNAQKKALSYLDNELKKYSKIKNNKYRFSFIVYTYVFFASVIISLTGLSYVNVLPTLRAYYFVMLSFLIVSFVCLCFSKKNRNVYNFMMIVVILILFVGMNYITIKFFRVTDILEYYYSAFYEKFGIIILERFNLVSSYPKREYQVAYKKIFYDPTFVVSFIGLVISYIMMKVEGKKENDIDIN